MKILHLIKSLGRGGAEVLLSETLQLHDSSKFEFHYIYFLPWKNQMVDALVQQGVSVTCLPANSNAAMLLQLPALVRYIKANKIELIHSHLPWAGFMARFAGKITGVPVFYTEHNKQEHYHTATRWINKFTFGWQKKVIAVSNDVEHSISKFIAPLIPVITIPNGINTQSFQRNRLRGNEIRKELGIDEWTPVVGTVCVFREQKRLDIWLSCFAALHQQFPSVRAIVVGDGPLKPSMIALRKQLNLEEVVFFPGLQTNTVDWLSAMDIFLMSSAFEGLPLALLEAMSCECAIVTTNAGGIKEVVTHEVDALVCETKQPEKLTGLCATLLKDHSLQIALSKQARITVENNFSLSAMVYQLEHVYTGFQQGELKNQTRLG